MRKVKAHFSHAPIIPHWWPWISVIVALVLLVGCATLQNLIDQPQLQSYTFNYDGHEYSALLPKEVPLPPEGAYMAGRCPIYWSGLCIMHVGYTHETSLYPTASFWFTKKLGVVAIVWHTLKPDGTKKYEGWLYIKGLPIKKSGEKIQALLDKLAPRPK